MSASDRNVECRICRIATAGNPGAAFDSIIAETEQYFAIASLGGFIPGWTLVCSRTHEFSLAAHCRSDEFHSFLSSVVETVSGLYGSPAIFEHGAIHENSITACGTSHAHLHVVPLQNSLERLVDHTPTTLSWREVPFQSLQTVVKDHEYLFFADRYSGPDTSGRAACLDVPQSQFFRRVLAGAMGRPELSNYRLAPLEDLASRTATQLRSRFRSSKRNAA